MRMDVATRKDLIGGGIVLVAGLGAVAEAFRYDLGSLRRMGPGFFPLALGVILAVTGALIILGGRRAPGGGRPAGERAATEWRGWLCICAGLVAFIVVGTYRGLLPATFAAVLVSAFGDRKNSAAAALALALAMTLVCFVVFAWLLQVQLPLFR